MVVPLVAAGDDGRKDGEPNDSSLVDLALVLTVHLQASGLELHLAHHIFHAGRVLGSKF